MKNIYIQAMEYGNKHLSGFKYPDMKNWIEKELGIRFTQKMEVPFVLWFLDSFASNDLRTDPNQKSKVVYSFRNPGSDRYYLNKFLESIWLMAGHTTKQYLDYLELKESREQAKRAFRTSLWSIFLAATSVIGSILFFLFSPKPADPPYDVRIIEDRVRNQELIEEIDSLKNEIYEANLLIISFENQDTVAK